MDKQYTKRELDFFHKGIENELKGIKEQLETMNGNVKDNTRWRWINTGALAVISALIIPIILIVINQWL